MMENPPHRWAVFTGDYWEGNKRKIREMVYKRKSTIYTITHHTVETYKHHILLMPQLSHTVNHREK